ncbi:MAG: hypothetical protein WBI82_15365 [Sphaerochaeta sp.]
MREHKKELTRKTTYNKVPKELSCMYTFTIKGKTTWCEIFERQALILNCLDIPPQPVQPDEMQAKPVEKRGRKPGRGYVLHYRT